MDIGKVRKPKVRMRLYVQTMVGVANPASGYATHIYKPNRTADTLSTEGARELSQE